MNPIAIIRRRILTTQFPYTHPLEHQFAIGIQSVCAGVGLAWVVWMLGFIIPQNILGNNPLPTTGLLAVFVTPIFAGAIYGLVSRGNLQRAIQLIVTMVVIGTLPVEGISPVSVGLLMFGLIASGLLMRPRSFVGVLILVIMGVVIIDLLRADQNTTQLLTIVLLMVLGAMILMGFSGSLRRIADRSYLQASHMRIVNRFTQTLQDGPDPARAVSYAIDLVVRELDYSFAQAFLADANGNLTTRIRAGLSVVSPSVNSTITLGDTSAIVQAARQREMVKITTRDSLTQRGHFIPSSREGIAIPLLHNQTVIGVFDIQSNNEENRFAESQLVVLRLIAGILAHHIGHIYTRDNLEQTVREQESLVSTLRADRNQPTAVGTRQSTFAGLSTDYLQNKIIGFDLVSDSNTLTPASDLPTDIQRALEAGDLVVEEVANNKVLSVPIRLRGDLLGAMSFVLPSNAHLSDRQIDLARSVTTRLSQAIETQQLFEQTQSQAARERRANETASRLLSSTDIRSVIRLAAESFNEALGAVNTRVYLDPMHVQANNPPQQTNEEPA